MKTVKINNEDIPVEDIIEVRTVFVSDELFKEVRYRKHVPCYHEVLALMPNDKGYKLEKAVRKSMLKR